MFCIYVICLLTLFYLYIHLHFSQQSVSPSVSEITDLVRRNIEMPASAR